MASKKDIQRARQRAQEQGLVQYHIKNIDIRIGSKLCSKAKKYKGFNFVPDMQKIHSTYGLR